MKKRWLLTLLAAALAAGAATSLSGCGGTAPETPPSGTAPSSPVASAVPEAPVPGSSEPVPAVPASVPVPSAPGNLVEENDSAVIDYSNAQDGYVMVKWTGGGDSRIAVQVKGPDNPEAYTYYLRAGGDYDVLPLSDGDGQYQILVCRNVSGTKYSQVIAANIDVKLSDSFAPFLRPNQYVSYTGGSEAVKKAQELVKDAQDNLGKVRAVYEWVVANLSYDYDKAAAVKTGYLPDVDKTMEEKKGICFDYASLMSAMLRSQGVPVKLVVGYTSKGEYHAWINVWSGDEGWMDSVIYFDGKAWKLMDPTFASSGKQSKEIMEYIGNAGNYQEKFVY